MFANDSGGANPSKRDLRRWQRYLAEELAEASVYRQLAQKKKGEERSILLSLAEAEARHEQHWRKLLGSALKKDPKPSLKTRFLGFWTRNFGGVFILALLQKAETGKPYMREPFATAQMAADETMHQEIIRALATRSRQKISGSFRAAIFGINDGLVSNTALVMGMVAFGAGHEIILAAGLSGLLSGALSMAAGEYVSVKSQREFLEASIPDVKSHEALADLDIRVNELELVYRAQGLDQDKAAARARRVFNLVQKLDPESLSGEDLAQNEDLSLSKTAPVQAENIGSAYSAALASLLLFASGALIPLIPYIFGLSRLSAIGTTAGLVAIALLLTGALIGFISGNSLWKRAFRQLIIGALATVVTYGLSYLFGVVGG